MKAEGIKKLALKIKKTTFNLTFLLSLLISEVLMLARLSYAIPIADTSINWDIGKIFILGIIIICFACTAFISALTAALIKFLFAPGFNSDIVFAKRVFFGVFFGLVISTAIFLMLILF
jgi:hypothetical protein